MSDTNNHPKQLRILRKAIYTVLKGSMGYSEVSEILTSGLANSDARSTSMRKTRKRAARKTDPQPTTLAAPMPLVFPVSVIG